MIGRRKAAEVVDRYGTNDLRLIVESEMLNVRTMDPWDDAFEDIFVHPTIFVPEGLERPDFRTRVAHCLGHHLLHAGNQIWLKGFDRLWNVKQEREADEFAAWLLIPEFDLDALEDGHASIIADRYALTEDLVRIRLEGL